MYSNKHHIFHFAFFRLQLVVSICFRRIIRTNAAFQRKTSNCWWLEKKEKTKLWMQNDQKMICENFLKKFIRLVAQRRDLDLKWRRTFWPNGILPDWKKICYLSNWKYSAKDWYSWHYNTTHNAWVACSCCGLQNCFLVCWGIKLIKYTILASITLKNRKIKHSKFFLSFVGIQ